MVRVPSLNVTGVNEKWISPDVMECFMEGRVERGRGKECALLFSPRVRASVEGQAK